nr:radical SAM protein [bacterium]
ESRFVGLTKVYKRKINFRGVENIIGELVFLTKSLKYDKIIFYDDNFFINKNRLKIILNRIIDLNLNIKWMALSRVDNIDKEVIELCKKSGCFRLDFGIESGSQRLLNAVNKKITVEEILTAYHLCIENDICFRPYIILGLPGETIDTIDETILLMKKINCDYSNYFAINILWILPNTQIYFSLKNQNKINDDVWMNKEDIIYYTQEHSYEELLKLKNYFGFHIPNGLLFYCNKLIDALINSLNRCFKNKKVFIYGTGEIRELIYFNKEKLNIVLVEQISSADFVFAASINNGDKIKNRLKLEINIPVFTIQELNSEYNLDLNFNDLNFYVMLYKEFKNKIRYDIEYFNSRISGIFFYKTNFLYNIFKLILNDVKSVKFLLQTSDTSKIDNNSEAFITFNNLERVDYLPNDYYYSFGKKRIL